MRRSAATVAAFVLMGTATAGVLPASGAQAAWPTWDGAATGTFRTSVVDHGEYIWTNGVFQARGANTDGLHHEDYWGPIATGGELPITSTTDLERHLTWGAFGVDRWATDGDQELPTDAVGWPAFTGELAEFRMAIDGADLLLRFQFTSMPRPDSQIATLAIAGAGAAAAPWPHGGEVSSPWSAAITTWGTGGTVTTEGGGPADLTTLGGEVRTGDHTVEVRVPMAALPAGPWTLTGGAGLTDPTDVTSYWAVPMGAATATAPGSGSSIAAGSPVWSLLFADDDPWVFTARSEGDLLVDGDVSTASVTVDPAVLAAGQSVPSAQRSGRLARQYTSAHDFGDGITKGDPAQELGPLVLPPEVPLDDVARSFEYTGRLQPYGMLVDPAYYERTEPWPLIVYLHGLNNYYYEPFGTLPNLELVGERGYLFAGLLGRGDLSYLGRGELDVMEVIADISAHYDVDPDRIHLMGHSMGSIGSHNVATRNPDLFASGSPAEITSSNALIENLRHVPWSMSSGAFDPLDAGPSEDTTYTTMSDLGYDVRWYEYDLKTHESSSIYDRLPSTLDLFDRTRRVVNPAEVVYTRLADDDDPDLGLVHDGAYQVDRMTFADATAPQTVRLESFAIPHARLDPASATREELDADEGGPSGRSQGTLYVTSPAYGEPVEVRNAGTIDLANVAALSLDAAGLSWSMVEGWVLDVATDSPVALSLDDVGTWAGQGLHLDGAEVASTVTEGAVTVAVPAGTHQLTIEGAIDTGAVPTPPTLPATGGGLAVVAGLALSAAAVAGRNRRTQRE